MTAPAWFLALFWIVLAVVLVIVVLVVLSLAFAYASKLMKEWSE